MKPCANHYITKQLSLQPYGEKKSAWTWTSVDFADPLDEDQTRMPEIFAVRFKTPQIAEDFRSHFEVARLAGWLFGDWLVGCYWFITWFVMSRW